jgi:hypothetical protein
MTHIVFVAPRLLENTLRYVRAFASLPEVELSVVTEDTERALPPDLRHALLGHYRVQNALNGADLAVACKWLHRRKPIDRLTGALEQLQVPLAIARDACGIDGMSHAVALNFRDKDRMKKILRAAGVPVAKSALCASVDEIRQLVALVGYPIIVKPQAGLGARATYRIESDAQLALLARTPNAPSATTPVQVEQFVRAREYTCETVTVRGKPVWRSGTRYYPSPLEVLENPWMQYCVLLPREQDAGEWADFAPHNTRALAALMGPSAAGATGTALTHMEWFLQENGNALVNEVGARPPGVCIMPLMSLGHNTDMVRDWARLIALDEFVPKPRVAAAGAAFLRGHGAGTHVAEVSGAANAIAALGPALIELRLPKVGQARSESYEGEGWATVRAPTTEGAKKALLTLIETIQVRYA